MLEDKTSFIFSDIGINYSCMKSLHDVPTDLDRRCGPYSQRFTCDKCHDLGSPLGHLLKLRDKCNMCSDLGWQAPKSSCYVFLVSKFMLLKLW